MNDALLVIDVFTDFDHDDGQALLSSFEERVPAMVEAIAAARSEGIPVLYVNDQHGRWNGDSPGLVRAAVEATPLLTPLVPDPGDPFLLKPRHSAFDHTPLVVLLRELEVERLLLVGAATEGVVQSGIDARELDFKVTILADACATNDPELEAVALRYAAEVGGMFVRAVLGAGSALAAR